MINCEICGKKTHERSGNILDDGRFVCVFCEQEQDLDHLHMLSIPINGNNIDPITEMLEGRTLEQLNELEQNLNQNIERIENYLKTIEEYLSDLTLMYTLISKRKEDLWSEFHRTVKEKLQASDLISEIHEKKRRLFYKKGELLICDFCSAEIKNDGEGSAFSNGTAFSNVGTDDRIACADCCGNMEVS